MHHSRSRTGPKGNLLQIYEFVSLEAHAGDAAAYVNANVNRLEHDLLRPNTDLLPPIFAAVLGPNTTLCIPPILSGVYVG